MIILLTKTMSRFIIDELYDRNTGSGQKQLILAAISLAVRELSGWSITTNATPSIASVKV